MTETGFKYFIEYMQERNAPPQPKPPKLQKQKLRDSYVPAAVPPAPLPDEDYAGAVCLLHTLTPMFPTYLEVLVDGEDLERLSGHRWNIVRSGSTRDLRVTNTRNQYLHTVVMNAPRDMVVDHINRRTLDNRRSKLRICTQQQNNINSCPKKNATSKYKGVYRCRKTGAWIVHVGRRGQRMYLGKYADEIEAARVYNEYAKKHLGEMAYLNPV